MTFDRHTVYSNVNEAFLFLFSQSSNGMSSNTFLFICDSILLGMKKSQHKE